MTGTARLIYVTAPDEQTAQSIADHLVEQGLAACVNILSGTLSTYRWEGRLCHEREAILLIKTTAAQAEKAAEDVKNRHPYECPCILILPVEGGFAPYLKWIEDQMVR